LTIFCFLVPFSFAEKIILKSGEIIEGNVIEKTDEYIKVDFYGLPLTYFMDNIASIGGKEVIKEILPLQSPLQINLTETYAKYNIIFKFPVGMELKEYGFTEVKPGENHSGIILGEFYPKEDIYNLIKISWIWLVPNDGQTNLLIEDGLKAAFKLMDSEKAQIIAKDKKETILNGHRLLYQFYEYKINNLTLYGVLSSWYCPESKKSFTLNVGYSKENVFPLFQKYLDAFICHK
jgi:hypothetical protein